MMEPRPSELVHSFVWLDGVGQMPVFEGVGFFGISRAWHTHGIGVWRSSRWKMGIITGKDFSAY